MSIAEENLSVNMINYGIKKIPFFALPSGFKIRWFKPEDIDLWVKLTEAADKYNEINAALFYNEFCDDSSAWHERICFIGDETGKEFGTAAAWYNNDFLGEPWGRIHWVSIVPEMQGKGLAKPLMSAVCERLVSLGHEKIYLKTSTMRVPAINLYRKFGFVPDISNNHKKQIWENFMSETGIYFPKKNTMVEL